MTPQEQLCEKMRVEQSAYCLWLTAQPPEEILHHAYEYSVREDIILATEEMNLTLAQVRALLKSPAPLADVYFAGAFFREKISVLKGFHNERNTL